MADRSLLRRLTNTPKKTLWLSALAVPVLVVLGLVLWKAPEWQTPAEITDARARAELQDRYRRTGVEIFLGGLALAGLFLVWRRVAESGRTAAVSRGQEASERFNQAIQQLASPSAAISLGGIYTLQRIAKDSPHRDHWPVVEVLTAYVRENARWPEPGYRNGATETNGTSSDPGAHRVHPNVQAALAVLGRRDRSGESAHQRLDLSATDLRGADLEEAQLQRADFTGANLQGARLGGAWLDGACLEGADLTGARLAGAHLTQARLRGANLSGAKLWDAHLTGADLQGANLQGAGLVGADLAGARLWEATLEGADLQGAKLDGAMGLPQSEPAPLPPSPAAAEPPPHEAVHEHFTLPPGFLRRTQTVKYLNGARRNSREHANGKSKAAPAPEPAPEPVPWGAGDEDS